MKKRILHILALVLVLGMTLGWTPAVMAEEEAGTVTSTLHMYSSKSANFLEGNWTGADNQKMVQIMRAHRGMTGSDFGYTEEWCADFVCDTATVAGVKDTVVPINKGTTSAYVPYMCKWFINNGATRVTVEEAMPGDIVMFDWGRTSNTQSCSYSQLDHVALVICYDSETHELSYIGGNQSSEGGTNYKTRKVTEVVMNVDESPYVGYIVRPNYATWDGTIPLHQVHVDVTMAGEGTGTIEGDGLHMQGSQAILTAVPDEENRFQGWYSKGGKLISTQNSISFTVEKHTYLTAKFAPGKECAITAAASRSGRVSGTGSYLVGDEVTLTAVPGGAGGFSGWYDEDENLLSRDAEYVFTAERDMHLSALFEGDVFMDVSDGDWFLDDTMEAVDRGLTNGVSALTFDANGCYTRAMAAVMLYRLDQSASYGALSPWDSSAGSPFSDLSMDAWYADEVLWAYRNGIVTGRDDGTFCPDEQITRQDFFTMAVRYLNALGQSAEPAALTYSDADSISEYALEAIGQAQAFGLLKGYGDGRLVPKDVLTRAQGLTLVIRIARLLV